MKRLVITVTSLLAGLLPLAPLSPAHATIDSVPSFKTVCTYGRSLTDDPIVAPQRPGTSHSHDFFGNVSTDAFSTLSSLQAAGTTCDFEEDLSAYWAPSLTVDGVVHRPQRVAAYYTAAGTDPTIVQPYPQGLRMIAGDSKATSPQSVNIASWSCAQDSDDAERTDPAQEIPTCGDGQHLRLRIIFPECWDGTNLDSADHKSHMAYMPKTGTCPATHPTLLPTLLQIVHFDDLKGGTGYDLASGGIYSGHADFFNVWQPTRLLSLVDTCLRKQQICRNADLRVAGSQATEGASLRFTISLGESILFPVTVNYTTTGRTAGADIDYPATTGSVTIPAGQTSATVLIPTVDDNVYEAPETLIFGLTSAENAAIVGGTATGTIDDNDAPPSVKAIDGSAFELLDGTSNLTCKLVLDKATETTVSVDFTTVPGTATPPGDYTATSGTISFRPGVRSKNVVVKVNPDSDFTEGTEDLSVVLSNPQHLTIADGVARMTISDPKTTPKLSVGDASAEEGVAERFVVSLSSPASAPVTVDYATVDAGAAAGVDYSKTTGRLTISAGATSGTIVVPTIEDGLPEDNEHFQVVLTNAANATLMDETGRAEIVDDEPLPLLSISDVAVTEPATGTKRMTFTVTMSTVSGRAVSFAWAAADRTAVAPGDYAAASGTLTFAAGTTSRTINVLANADSVGESVETMEVRLSGVDGALLQDGVGVGTINP